MERHTVTTNGDAPSERAIEVLGDDAEETQLDRLIGQRDVRAQELRWWRRGALGALAVAGLCAGLAYLGWYARPEVVPLVQHVFVDAQGTAVSVGPPIPMAQYTPQDWQWIQMVREYVVRLRWRGLDEGQLIQAWQWLELHTCGQAEEQLRRYKDVEKPFEKIGLKRREISNVNVTKGDMPLMYTVLWTEIYTAGVQLPVTTTQSVTFGVARRAVEPAQRAVNGFGLCVRVIGGLTL